MEKYQVLREQYPDYVSLDQFYRICGIAKRSALYLVQNGIIPSVDTGRQTWRYQIAIEDVITYLRKREEVGSMIPPGAVTSRQYKKRVYTGSHKSFSQIVRPGHEREIGKYFAHIYADFPDILTADDVAEMTGLNKSSVLKLLKAGTIRAIEVKPKYLIPKQYLLEFVVTRRFFEAKTDSEDFKKILGGFEIWKTARS